MWWAAGQGSCDGFPWDIAEDWWSEFANTGLFKGYTEEKERLEDPERWG
jgi:hypothetical protein